MVNNHHFSPKDVELGLISALCHDTWYIKTIEDNSGTGAKYTLIHISRSIAFMDKYFTEKGYPARDIEYCANLLKCTGLNVNVNSIHFLSPENEILGKIVGTADLLGQMANRAYLEKLPFLYHEFKEGNVEGFKSERDFFEKTPGFFDTIVDRFEHGLGGIYRYMRDHFRVRWGIDEDFYVPAIKTNIRYLKYVLKNYQENYQEHLRRAPFIKAP